jgi:hypothetical protein
MHCEGDGIDEELVSLGKLMVSEGAALREAGAKFSNISRSGGRLQHCFLELFHFHVSQDMYT